MPTALYPPPPPSRVLTDREQRLWLDVSSTQQRWQLVHWYSAFAFHTGMQAREIRALRVRDVDLDGGLVVVRPESPSCGRRRRTVPLTAAAQKAAEHLLRRAESLGAQDPEHYLFPFRDPQTNRYLPLRPMTNSGIKRLWQEVRQASGLTSFRPSDTRRTTISRLVEGGVPLAVIVGIVGFVSERVIYESMLITAQARRCSEAGGSDAR